MSRSGNVKKFEFLHPFSKATEKTEKIMFCFGSALYWTESKKFVYNNQQCFFFQNPMLTTSCRILTLLSPSIIKFRRQKNSKLLFFWILLNTFSVLQGSKVDWKFEAWRHQIYGRGPKIDLWRSVRPCNLKCRPLFLFLSPAFWKVHPSYERFLEIVVVIFRTIFILRHVF